MKLNSKQVKQNIRQYILDNITLEGHELPSTIQNLFATYMREKGDHKPANKSQAYDFADWLKGIPSAFNVAVYYREVDTVLIDVFKIDVPKTHNDEKAYTLYLRLIYQELIYMLKKDENALSLSKNIKS